MKASLILVLLLALALPLPAMVTTSNYGVLPNGRPVSLYVLTNAHGLRVSFLDYGATMVAVETPDRAGKIADVTHGYDDLAGWLTNTAYFGACVGRFANRIAAGRFSLDGESYQLATNNTPGGQPCHLHGGKVGFDKQVWTGQTLEKAGAQGVEFTRVSPHGEEGYPGTLTVRVTYWLTDLNELTIDFHAITDRATIINLTNHTYWNLTADPREPITGHVLQVEADAFLPVNAGLIPTGERAPVSGTPFDFTQPAEIGRQIGAAHEQVKLGNGFDHCWVLRDGKGLRRAARVVEPRSGRVLELFSDQPGVQVYTGNFLDGTTHGKGGVPYGFRTAFCLEPQRFPDAPNQPDFPSAVLRPGESYTHALVYRFSTLTDGTE